MSKNYSNTAAQVSLTSSVNAVATTLPVSGTTGFPAVNFTLVLGAGTVNEELVLVTGVSGTNLTVTRGYDNTTAVAHDSGTVVQHAHSAEDFALSRAHEAATSNVHGVTGSLVGTSNAQTLTNKTLGSTNIINGFTVNRLLSSDGTGRAVASSKAVPVGDVVGTSDAQVLLNKDLSSVTNSFPASLVTTSGTQDLTNKTLVDPVLDTPTTLGSLAGFGGPWTAYTPSVGGAVVSSISGRYQQIGKTIHCMGMATFSSVSGAMFFGLPVTAQTSQTIQSVGTWMALDVGTSRYTGGCNLRDNATFYAWPTNGPSALGPTTPFTWVSGDQITWNITYEAA